MYFKSNGIGPRAVSLDYAWCRPIFRISKNLIFWEKITKGNALGLERFWQVLGRSWAAPEHLGRLLGGSWAVLGSSWVILGGSWAPLGAYLGALGPHVAALEALFESTTTLGAKSVLVSTNFGPRSSAPEFPFRLKGLCCTNPSVGRETQE